MYTCIAYKQFVQAQIRHANAQCYFPHMPVKHSKFRPRLRCPKICRVPRGKRGVMAGTGEFSHFLGAEDLSKTIHVLDTIATLKLY